MQVAMPFDGVIIALDLGSTTGVCEGVPGCIPTFGVEKLRKPTDGDDYETSWGRAVKFIARRIAAPREINGRFYADGEAASAGLVRLAVEAPIMVLRPGKDGAQTNHDALLITKALWACTTGFAVARGVMTRRWAVGTIRKHFLGTARIDGPTAKREAKRVCEAYGWAPPSLDCADAGAVFHIAACTWNPEAMRQFMSPMLARGGQSCPPPAL
jgi:hypothetical protein